MAELGFVHFSPLHIVILQYQYSVFLSNSGGVILCRMFLVVKIVNTFRKLITIDHCFQLHGSPTKLRIFLCMIEFRENA